MFKLIPFILILLMITQKGNHFNKDDITFYSQVPTEYLITNTYVKKSLVSRRFLNKKNLFKFKNPQVVDLRRKMTKEILNSIRNSKISFLVDLDDDEKEELKEFFVN